MVAVSFHPCVVNFVAVHLHCIFQVNIMQPREQEKDFPIDSEVRCQGAHAFCSL